MAKVALSKLGLKTNSDIQLLSFGDGEIEVRSYLPIQEKIELISKIVNQSIDDNGYWNPIRVKVFMTLEVMYAYTNINFTDKMKENIFKTYDLIVSSGLFDKVLTTNLVYQSPELLKREYYVNVDMSKYIALLIDTLNHDSSISQLLNPIDKINARLEKYREEHK
jgi:phosphoribosylpyrophosphate synthetase